MNYDIITDEYELTKFIEWLPELTPDECFYVALFARKKYHPSAKNDKSNVKRFTATSKDWLLHKIKQLEVPIGTYTNKDGSGVHQDSLALYISPNPRSFKQAQISTIKVLLNKALDPNNVQNPSAIALSEIQKSKSRVIKVDFDFDIKDPNYSFSHYKEKNLDDILPRTAYDVLFTRGGFHLLVTPVLASKHNKRWYPDLIALAECDVCGDNMIPIPGCIQGGFTPLLCIREDVVR